LPTATEEEIRKAKKDMLKKCHPDKVAHLHPDFQRLAHEKTKEINEAWDIISKEKGFGGTKPLAG
jgi:DnaJ like chaperone protein